MTLLAAGIHRLQIAVQTYDLDTIGTVVEQSENKIGIVE